MVLLPLPCLLHPRLLLVQTRLLLVVFLLVPATTTTTTITTTRPPCCSQKKLGSVMYRLAGREEPHFALEHGCITAQWGQGLNRSSISSSEKENLWIRTKTNMSKANTNYWKGFYLEIVKLASCKGFFFTKNI